MLSPLVLPLHGSAAVRALNARVLPALVTRATRRLGMTRPILWAYVPQAEALLDALNPSLVVYHCVDDISAHELIDTDSFRAAEERFAGRADLVLASAPELIRRMRELSANVLEAPNVADTELFATALEPGPDDPGLTGLPRPRIVFTGAISAVKLDLVLLLELARRRADLVVRARRTGRARAIPTPTSRRWRGEPNVHLLGMRAYEQLPAVLRGADAGLIPYARNALTDSIFPMKVYEYLAAGLPVVSTPLPALEGVTEVATASSRRSCLALLDEALASDGPEARQERSRPRWATPGSAGCARSPRRSTRCERPARHHPHACRRLGPVDAHLRDRAGARRTPRGGPALRPFRRGRAGRRLPADPRIDAARGRDLEARHAARRLRRRSHRRRAQLDRPRRLS